MCSSYFSQINQLNCINIYLVGAYIDVQKRAHDE